MNKHLKYSILTLMLVVGVFGFLGTGSIRVAEAETGVVTQMVNQQIAASNAANTTTTIKTDPNDPCDGFRGFMSDPIGCGIAGLANLMLTIVSKLLWISGLFLNGALNITLNLSTFTEKIAIESTWKIFRDLINISFIFIILWIAISTILGLSDYKKLLTSLVISAIFINFSLFFTKVIIDSSNIVALQFYSAIAGQTINPLSPNNPSTYDSPGLISNRFMEVLKLQSNFDDGKVAGGQEISVSSNGGPTGLKALLVGIFGSILIIITAVVFFVAALLLISRTAILVFLMVTSPIGFAGGLTPKTSSYSKKWWTMLINQALMAPVFLMLMWAVFNMVGSADLLGTSDANRGALTFAGIFGDSQASSIGILINYVIIMAFLIFALNVTRELSDSAGRSGATFLGGVIGGTVGAVGRNSLGLAASRIAKSKTLQEFAGKSAVGEYALKGVRNLSTANYDIRSAKVPKSLGGGVINKALSDAGLEAGLGKATGDGGFEKGLDESKKEKLEFGKSLTKSARTPYAKRISNSLSIPFTDSNKTGIANKTIRPFTTIAGALGRSNRLAAAQLLKDKEKELTTTINQLTSELARLQQIPPGQIRPEQQARIDELISPVGNPPGDGMDDSIADNTALKEQTKQELRDIGISGALKNGF